MGKTEVWPPWEVTSLERRLDELRDAVAERPKTRSDDEQIWLTRFLVLRACGYLEQAVHETLRGYLNQKSSGMVRAFTLSWIERSRNPTPANLLGMVGRLDANLLQQLTDFLEGDEKRIENELHLLIGRRHQIAHGLNEGLGSKKALEMVDTTKEVAAWFIRALNPHQSARSQ